MTKVAEGNPEEYAGYPSYITIIMLSASGAWAFKTWIVRVKIAQKVHHRF